MEKFFSDILLGWNWPTTVFVVLLFGVLMLVIFSVINKLVKKLEERLIEIKRKRDRLKAINADEKDIVKGPQIRGFDK